MFIQPVSSPPPGMSTTTTTATASPASPSRPSRLRGLSYLRNYTQNHILSRDGHHHSAAVSTGNNSGNNSGNESGNTTPPGRQQRPGGAALTRSASYSPTSSGPQPSPTPQNNRLTLISSTPTDPASPRPAAATSQSSLEPADEGLENHAAEASTIHPIASAGISTSTSNNAASTPGEPTMGRNRASMAAADATTTSAAAAAAGVTNGPETAPSIRFSAYYDPRSTRPSLTFPPISRTLPTGSEKIRVGRYSERDSQSMSNMPGNQPSAAPVGFKSKVVSRRHCEFWYEDGKWYIKDVKSSSGTFLNHIRLSPPSQESKAFPVNDGDIVQLGIDFKGGEEMIFRCVKMRLELNRGWQNKLNTFNMAAHKRLQTMALAGAASTSSQECTICLGSIAPCQSLFVAPCSHTWHFKCVRSLLTSPQYPIFICPNCRAGADLEADVDEIEEEWQQLNAEKQKQEEAKEEEKAASASVSEGRESHEVAPVLVEPVPSADRTTPERSTVDDTDAMDVTVDVAHHENSTDGELSHTVSEPLPIRNPASGAGRPSAIRSSRSPSPQVNAEGPITPRNDAGPWVFDGSAGREGEAEAGEMRSLDAAADMDLSDPATSDISSSSSLRVEHHS